MKRPNKKRHNGYLDVVTTNNKQRERDLKSMRKILNQLREENIALKAVNLRLMDEARRLDLDNEENIQKGN